MKRSIALAAILVVAAGIGGTVWYRNSTGYWIGQLADATAVERRQEAVEVLGQRDDSSVEAALLGAAQDPDGGVRMRVFQALRYRASEAAVEPLIAALNAEADPWRRDEIAQVLGQIRDGRAADALLTALPKAEDDSQRNDIAQAIGQLGADGVPGLVALMNDPAAEVRVAAIDALDFSISAVREKGEDVAVLQAAVDPLIASLQDPEAKVRISAIDTLGSLGNPRAVDPLLALLGGDDPTEREVLARVLSYYGEPAFERVQAAFQNGPPEVRIGAAEALAEFDLRATLGYAGEDVRATGAKAAAVLDSAVAQHDLAVVGAYVYFIRHGRSDAVPVLVDALNAYGNEPLAERFLNAGNSVLADAATAWADAHGYTVETTSQSNGQFQWGSAQ